MKRLFFMLFIVPATGMYFMACGQSTDPALYGTHRQAIQGNGGVFVSSESTRADQGRYREVMYVLTQRNDGTWGGCTGVVIAPYAVLTAAHCRGSLSNNRANRFVRWNGISLPIQNDFTNPFAANLKFYRRLNLPIPHSRQNGDDEERPFAPQWYLDEKQAQRTDPLMLPHMHDSHIFFVPGLTPAFISQNGIKIAAIDAFAFTRPMLSGLSYQTFRGVGVGSTGGSFRRSVRYQLANPNHRNGFLTINSNAFGFGRPDPGDSGGPIFGQLWGNGVELVNATNVLLGTQQNGGPVKSDLVPMAYHPSAPAANNPETMESIRRNHLWTMARAQDVDNDGITSACDPNPAATNLANQNQCPSPVGTPQGWSTHGYPKGLLMCPKFFYVTGIRGRYSYNGVIQMAVQCRPRTCLQKAGSCSSEFWTDTYGGDANPDGNQYAISTKSSVCGSQRALKKMRFRVINNQIFHIKAYCSDFKQNTNVRYLIPLGREGGTTHTRQCPSNQHIVGIVAHNQSFKRISGIQVICSGNVGS